MLRADSGVVLPNADVFVENHLQPRVFRPHSSKSQCYRVQ